MGCRHEDGRRIHTSRGVRADPRGAARARLPEHLDHGGEGLGASEGDHRALPRLVDRDPPPAEAQAGVRGRGRGHVGDHRDDPEARPHGLGRGREDLRPPGRGCDPHPDRRVRRGGAPGAPGRGRGVGDGGPHAGARVPPHAARRAPRDGGRRAGGRRARAHRRDRHSARRRSRRGHRAAARDADRGMGPVRAIRGTQAGRGQAGPAPGGDGRGADRLRRPRSGRRADARCGRRGGCGGVPARGRRRRPYRGGGGGGARRGRAVAARIFPGGAAHAGRSGGGGHSPPGAAARDRSVRGGRRLGTDLAEGAVALVADPHGRAPGRLLAAIAGERSDALAQTVGDRVYALIPSTVEEARRVATRLGRQATVGVSSRYTDPGDMRRALEEAELVLEVTAGGAAPEQDIGGGTYRLLFRVLASHPEEVRSFYEDTIAPVVRYDEQYSTELVGTLESYLAQNCNMNATAQAIYAHRHTVSYRLERVRDLTVLDPFTSEDRERLGLGLKAYRIIAPRLPR